MPALPCANHPKEETYVRCARCDKPICVRCMVDTPVGKKCRECAQNRTHLSTASPKQALLALAAATAAAVPAGAVLLKLGILILPAVVYGYVVAQAALWGGSRSRSVAVQIATAVAALVGGVIGTGITVIQAVPGVSGGSLAWHLDLGLFSLLNIGIGIFAAVSRVRFL